MSILKHSAGICVAALMRYLGSGPQELYPQFYRKAEMLSSLGTRNITGVPYVSPTLSSGAGVCALEPELPGSEFSPAVHQDAWAGWLRSLHVGVLVGRRGVVVLLPRRFVVWIKRINTCECLTQCTMSFAILTPNIGHGKKKRLLLHVTG